MAKWRWSPTARPVVPVCPRTAPFSSLVPHLHVNLAQVAVAGKDPQAVVQDHRLAVNPQGFGVDHHAVVAGVHRAVHQGGQVLTQVGLLIHGFALVQVGAPVPEAGHGLAEKPLKSPGPQGLGVAVGRDFLEQFVILVAAASG